MEELMNTLKMIWTLCIGWMPPLLAAICTVSLIILFVFLVVKLIGFILDAIPFL